MLRLRAKLFAQTRAFFAAQDVLEVETPILGQGLVVEAEIDPVPCLVRPGQDSEPEARHLLSSPEGPMKRLLAAGSGAIYQLAHAFRDGESGRRHSPEFTLLEWYRPGFDHHDLMDDVEALVRTLLPSIGEQTFERRTYRDLFQERLGIDPFATSLAELRATADRQSLPVPADFDKSSIDDALDLLLVTQLEPDLGRPTPLFLFDYPASQAALAQVHRHPEHGNLVAQRFELYIDGIELANGYHELGDPSEQASRFAKANDLRAASGRARLPVDKALIAALEHGMPSCAGVALGFDRLMMLAAEAVHIDTVRGLPFEPPRPGL